MAPPGAQWGEWTRLKGNAAELLAAEASLAGQAVYMSSTTDPYQPAERDARITRVMAAQHQGVRLVVQTRGPLVTRDTDLLLEIGAQVNITVTTDSEGVRAAFEPYCPSITQRLNAARELVAASLKVVVTVTPMLPLGSVQGFADTLADLDLRGVVMQPFHDAQGGCRVGARHA